MSKQSRCSRRMVLVWRTLPILVPLIAGCDGVTAPRHASLVTSVGVVPGALSAAVGDSVRLNAVLRDAGQRVLDRPVVWSSSDTRRASVSPNGLVRALASGQVTITATADSVAGSSSLTIDSRVAASLAIEPDSLDLLPRQSARLRAVVRDSTGDEIPRRRVEWSSSRPGVLQVRQDGYIHASGHDALITIRARLGDLEAEARVLVLPDPCLVSMPIDVGETVNASLTRAECRRSGGNYAAR